MTTLDYIEQQYKTATLTELCEKLHLPMHMLSKMIRKNTGFNFKELLQRKRLNKAVELMCETDPVSYTHLDRKMRRPQVSQPYISIRHLIRI